jgi:hypothetical protein
MSHSFLPIKPWFVFMEYFKAHGGEPNIPEDHFAVTLKFAKVYDLMCSA